jgi:alanine racemase
LNRRLLIDLEALAANYRQFLQATVATDAEVGAVVKADAYGLGAAAVAGRLSREGCRSFFVATTEEALGLRAALGGQPDIYAFEGPVAGDAADLAAARVIPILNQPAQLDAWRAHSERPIGVHVDTGMSRLGFPGGVEAGLFAGFKLTLLVTHLACADQPDDPRNEVQLARFAEIRSRFPGVRVSIGNSAGWLTGAARQGHLGRPGIGLYGGNPFSDRPNPYAPVAALEGRVLQLRALAAGEAVGYGASYVAPTPRRVAVVALGYADGVPRLLSGRGEFAVAGQRAPVLGRVSMDMTAVDVTGIDAVQVGDWVECFGTTVSVDEVAGWAGTIDYEILTGIGSRVRRVYVPAAG